MGNKSYVICTIFFLRVKVENIVQLDICVRNFHSKQYFVISLAR